MHKGWSLWLVACGGKEPELDWLVEPLEMGSYASETGYLFEDPQSTWFAAEHVLPSLRWSVPASNIPLYLWEDVLSGEDVMDAGSCPYLTVQDGKTTWSANCRSQEGYNWTGQVSVTKEDTDTWRIEHWEFDMEVSSDRDERHFDWVLLDGEVRYVTGDDDPLARQAQANIHIEAPGYWAGAFQPELDSAWSDMNLTGIWEAQATGAGEKWRIEAHADLGSRSGFSTSSDALHVEDSCAGEPRGQAVFIGNNTARLEFEGADGCNGCAQLWIDAERSPNACQDGR